MTSSASNHDQYIRECIAACQSGFSLPQEFYLDPAIYLADIDRIWRRGWLFVGFTCQIPNQGDYVTFQLHHDSIILVRSEQDQLAAFHNLCRHRGSLICDGSQGTTKRFVCPYHQWTYGLDGELLSCRGMQPEPDKDRLGLAKIHVRELAGMIFVCLADDPPDFAPADQLISPLATPQGFEQARIAKMIDYEVAANWKLVWENNRECYHCNVNHPQYIKANFDIYDQGDLTERISGKLQAQLAKSEASQQATGIAVTHSSAGIAPFPDAENDLWYSANRTVLAEGFCSESMDGSQIAPLMGAYSDVNVGTLRIRTMPNMWNHSSCDHGVTSRLLPLGPERTQVRVMWLVDEQAVEGVDYELESLLPFWKLTSEQDWELCERAQKGVRSSQYRPGPYSTSKEYNVDAFVRWYLQKMSGH